MKEKTLRCIPILVFLVFVFGFVVVYEVRAEDTPCSMACTIDQILSEDVEAVQLENFDSSDVTLQIDADTGGIITSIGRSLGEIYYDYDAGALTVDVVATVTYINPLSGQPEEKQESITQPGQIAGYYQAPNGLWYRIDVSKIPVASGDDGPKPRCYSYPRVTPGTRRCGGGCGVVSCTSDQNDDCGHSWTALPDGTSFNSCTPIVGDWGACDADHKRTRTCVDTDGYYDIDGDGLYTSVGDDGNDCPAEALVADCIGAIQGTLFDASDLSTCDLGSVGSAATLGVVATGGTVTYDGAYTVHTFNTSGVFSVSEAGIAEVLVVG
ncbi:MAG TPA: hypothetical protein VLH94_03075, partial [Spirochaetia bacterium]|nr:hypothetical protein [Spirochaetia bacterium]